MYNQPVILEKSRVGLHHLKLDLVAGANFAWRMVHNHMLMHSSVALDNLTETIPPIDSDQKVALLHAPFNGTTLFGGELAKLHRANKARASLSSSYPSALSLTQAMVDLSGKLAPTTGRVAGIEIRVDPPLRPQQLDCPSLKAVRPP